VQIREKELATLKSQIDYEVALQEDRYKKGEITFDAFLNFKTRRTEDYTNRILYLIGLELEALGKSPEENLQKIAELEEKKKQLLIQTKTEQIKLQQEIQEDLKETYEKDFDNWDSLQELKLQSLKARLDLQNTVEETAVKQGLMRQSELMENQLDRLRQQTEAEIDIIEEKMQRIAELEGAESPQYEQLAADRLRLQHELEAKIIESEANIAEQRINEEKDATQFISQYVDVRLKLAEQERDEKLRKLKEYYDQALISEFDYQKSVLEVERDFSDERDKISGESYERANKEKEVWVTTYNDIADAMHAMVDYVRSAPWFTSQSLFGKGLYATKALFTEFSDAVKKVYGDTVEAMRGVVGAVDDAYADIKASGISGIADAQGIFRQLLSQYNTSIEGFYNWMTGTGKKIAESVGMTVQEWIGRVADYVNYVKGLLQSLQDYIAGLRQQLMQLKGDRLGEIEMWYEQERKKLEEKYGEELKNTKEYYEAMALLAELYKEKKRKILEEMDQDEEEFEERTRRRSGVSGGEGGGAGSIGGLSGILKNFLPDLSGLTAGMSAGAQSAEVKVSKEIRLDSIFEVKTYDPDTTDRYIRDIFFPRFERYLKLKGIEL
jgi:hypothetical protein